ncbi:pyridoxamine 5'-phosphate oxidase family protein [Paraglaciecola sp. L3A3]|uniref:pyridoxamine 5'-phosphate oxidase family protein n=1 Tax=Paraglaciecola sp. L3A3 TaxID=2686358 RepID=UPI00131B3EC3|nr:pyridoxamine 5'-phosphate oxidase family protein [Paraglaciecola sp. L3A3]
MSADILNTMWQKLADSPLVMVGLNNNSEHSEPMRAQLDENAKGHFWFYTTIDNRIAQGGSAMLQFASKDHELFACIAGQLVAETDEQIIEKYWSSSVEAWYKEGKKDPKLSMMRFELDSAEIWTVDPSMVGLIKLTTGATLSAEEMGSHKKIAF